MLIDLSSDVGGNALRACEYLIPNIKSCPVLIQSTMRVGHLTSLYWSLECSLVSFFSARGNEHSAWICRSSLCRRVSGWQSFQDAAKPRAFVSLALFQVGRLS